MTSLRLFTIHHGACTGGSIISQILSTSTNSALISEINPFYFVKSMEENLRFDPQNILNDLQVNSEQLEHKEALVHFSSQMMIALRHCDNLSINLFLRDHSHSTFNFRNRDIKFFGNKWESKFLYALQSIQSNKTNSLPNFLNAIPFISVRHPLDSYISLRERGWLNAYCGDKKNIDEYCKSLLRFQNYFCDKKQAIVIRYEDICDDFRLYLPKFFEKLNLDFKLPSLNNINKMMVSGKSGRQSLGIAKRGRRYALIDSDLIKSLDESSYYQEYCELNSYRKNHDEPEI